MDGVASALYSSSGGRGRNELEAARIAQSFDAFRPHDSAVTVRSAVGEVRLEYTARSEEEHPYYSLL